MDAGDRYSPRAFQGPPPASWLRCGISAVAFCLGSRAARAAGDPRPDAHDQESQQGESIVITGSRIRVDGMEPPIPVTAVGAEALESMAPTTLVDGLSQLPVFYGNQTPNSTASWFERGGYGNLDLRGLGINRTLTLVNGRRVISSNAFGGVDINVIPEALVRSVEVVTGGASAAYGTDAVAGVVNFLPRHRLHWRRRPLPGRDLGPRATAENYEFLGDLGDAARAIAAISSSPAEKFDQNGVHNYADRDWYQAWGTVPDATGQLLIRPHVVSRNATFDGLIFCAGFIAQWPRLPSRRQLRAIPERHAELRNARHAAARHSIAGGGSGDDLGGEVQTLYPDVERDSFFAYGDYEVADGLNLFAQFVHGSNSTFRFNTPRGSLQSTPTQIRIFQDNAFLPAPLRQAMINEGLQSFILKRQGSAEDIGANITLRDRNEMNSITAGFRMGHRGRRLHGRVDRRRLLPIWRERAQGLPDRAEGRPDLRRRRCRGQSGDRPDRLPDHLVQHPVRRLPAPEPVRPRQCLGRSGRLGRRQRARRADHDAARLRRYRLLARHHRFLHLPGSQGEHHRHDPERRRALRQRRGLGGLGRGSDHRRLRPGLSRRGHLPDRPRFDQQVVRPCRRPPGAVQRPIPRRSPPACAASIRPTAPTPVGIQYSKVSNIQGSIEVAEAFGETIIPIVADQGILDYATLHLAARYADYTGSGGNLGLQGRPRRAARRRPSGCAAPIRATSAPPISPSATTGPAASPSSPIRATRRTA
jgi:hypothetical protein